MAVEKKNRNLMPEQDAAVRARNFKEVALGFSAELARDEASRCLNCKNAPCMKGCPVGVRIPEFLALVRDGRFEEAGEVINHQQFAVRMRQGMSTGGAMRKKLRARAD